MNRLTFTLAILIAGSANLNAASIVATSIVVPGTANIFGAGHLIAPAPAGGGSGALPPSFDLPTGSDRILSFSSITGVTNCCGGASSLDSGPDGRAPVNDPTNISSFGGISGIQHDTRTFFLVGVFLTTSEPFDPAPLSLNFTGTDNFASISPLLNQMFFIGDGLTGTGSGAIQQFRVPNGATRFYMGVADGYFVQGAPGFYGDNTGAWTATFNVVPEPSTLAMLLGTLSVLSLRRRMNSPEIS